MRSAPASDQRSTVGPDLAGRAGHAVLPKFGGFASDRRGAPLDLRLVGPGAGNERDRVGEVVGVTTLGLAGPPHDIALGDVRIDGGERQIELRRRTSRPGVGCGSFRHLR